MVSQASNNVSTVLGNWRNTKFYKINYEPSLEVCQLFSLNKAKKEVLCCYIIHNAILETINIELNTNFIIWLYCHTNLMSITNLLQLKILLFLNLPWVLPNIYVQIFNTNSLQALNSFKVCRSSLM